MPQVTEIATLFLKADTDVEDPSSSASQVAQEAFSIIASQPGFQRLYYGSELEHASLFQLFVDWDGLERHEQFKNSPAHAAFSEAISTILTRAPYQFHFVPKPSPPAILGGGAAAAPVVEIATFFQTDDDILLPNVERFMAVAVAPHALGYLGHAFGPVVEEIEKDEGAGLMGTAVVLCIGWESVQAHMAFRETEAFKTHIHLLREGTKGAEMHHVAFKSLTCL